MNKKISLTAVYSTVIFAIIAVLAFAGVEFPMVLRAILYFLVVPLYFLLLFALFYTAVKWYNDRTKNNMRYLIYSILSFFLTSGLALAVFGLYME